LKEVVKMRTKMIAVAIVVTILGVAAFFAQGYKPVAAQGTTETPVTPITRTVSVTAEGVVTGTPDQATIYIGVQTEGDTSDEALTANNDQMTALLATLRGAGVVARDLQTRDFSIYPRYADSTNGELRINGYVVSNSVHVTVRNLDNLGTILDAAVEAGGNQVSGISFGFSDPSALVEQAREQAVANARANAEQLATLTDAELGSVVSISEGINNYPTPIFRETMGIADTASIVPIETGESSVSVSVSLTYELIVE
jgi:uncharacterized protein YggE